MKKGLPTTDSPDDKINNFILAFEPKVVKDSFKELAIIVALKEVAKQNELSIRQQVEIYSPAHWNDPPPPEPPANKTSISVFMTQKPSKKTSSQLK